MSERLPSRFDGAILSEFKIEQGHIVRKETQPGQDNILAFNQELRKDRDALRHLEFMGLELNIPELDLRALWQKYPDLKSLDRETRKRAWMKFLGSSEADPYRVRARNMARQKNGEGPTIIVR